MAGKNGRKLRGVDGVLKMACFGRKQVHRGVLAGLVPVFVIKVVIQVPEQKVPTQRVLRG
jgi:hypothetical protein